MQVHRILRLVVAFAIGVSLAFYVYERISDPRPAMQRAREEAVVLSARDLLESMVSPGATLHVVDPLATDRSVGKTYVYPSAGGWEVSGHYRRPGADRWSPFLMHLDENVQLVSLQVRDDDERLVRLGREDPRITVSGFSASSNDPENQADN